MTTHIYFPTLENGPISWNWITLNGPDAKDFLHRLTTVDLRQLDIGSGAPGCFLTAQGKIRSYFYLWNLQKDHYAFELDAGSTGKWKNDLLSIIDQYTFGEKITVTDLTPTLKCVWLFPDETEINRLGSALETKFDNETVSGLKICHHGTLNYERAWITLWGTPEVLENWILKNLPKQEKELSELHPKQLSFNHLETWRIQAVQPRMDSEITELVVPLEIGLRTAIADNKGCYPGQEVIEKIVALGSPAKRLVRIEGFGPAPQAGEPVQAINSETHEIGSEIGTITTTSPIDADKFGSSEKSKFIVLALIRKTHAKEGTPVGFLNSPQIRGTVIKIAPHA